MAGCSWEGQLSGAEPVEKVMLPAGHRAQWEPNQEPASWLRVTALTTEDGPWAGLCRGPQVSWPPSLPGPE